MGCLPICRSKVADDLLRGHAAPAQSSNDWVAGTDASVETYKPDPSKPAPTKRATTYNGHSKIPSSNGVTESSTSPPKTSVVDAPLQRKPREESNRVPVPSNSSTLSPRAETASDKKITSDMASISLDESKPADVPAVSAPSPPAIAPAAQTRAPDAQTSNIGARSSPFITTTTASRQERFNPGWSRSFLLGKTPLKPDYFDVHDLSVTMSADVELLKVCSSRSMSPCRTR